MAVAWVRPAAARPLDGCCGRSVRQHPRDRTTPKQNLKTPAYATTLIFCGARSLQPWKAADRTNPYVLRPGAINVARPPHPTNRTTSVRMLPNARTSLLLRQHPTSVEKAKTNKLPHALCTCYTHPFPPLASRNRQSAHAECARLAPGTRFHGRAMGASRSLPDHASDELGISVPEPPPPPPPSPSVAALAASAPRRGCDRKRLRGFCSSTSPSS